MATEEALGKPICCYANKNTAVIVGFDTGCIVSYPSQKILPWTKPVEVTTFLMDSELLIYGNVYGQLTLEAENSSEKIMEKIHETSITGLALVSANILASCSLDGCIKIWTLKPKLRQIGEYVLASQIPFSCLSCVVNATDAGDEVTAAKKRKMEEGNEKWMTLLAGDIEGGLHILEVFKKE